MSTKKQVRASVLGHRRGSSSGIQTLLTENFSNSRNKPVHKRSHVPISNTGLHRVSNLPMYKSGMLSTIAQLRFGVK